MSLHAGTRVGVYEVIALIGAGGMGEVYRARDTRLKRDVALKVIPEALTQDRERLARFKREAELLASLNHPHIASIYGFEESDGIHAIAMEFVDGGTLADRLRAATPEAERESARPREGASAAGRGGGAPRTLSLDDALVIARQVAEALEAAHEKGIVHRDLKPGNIALTADGQVKVLDFGLAKALAPELHAPSDLPNSPTLTSPAMTQLGLILGTAAYMSPEQAKGRPADKRGDVWAFGCVLYEMLTGRRPFEGEDVSDTLAAVLRGDPDWTALPDELPPPVRTLLQRCLEKDRRKRVGDMAAALFVFNESSLAAPARVEAPVAAAGPGRMRERALWLALTLVIGALALWFARPRVTPPVPIRFHVFAPAGTAINNTGIVTLSPDGRRALFIVARPGGQSTALAVRSFDTVDSRVLEGTDGAVAPFWSPDSRFIGFQADGKLKKLDVANGGPPQPLCDAQTLVGGTWSPDGTIVFSPATTGGLMRVSQAGGTPSPVTTLDTARQERSHRWPWFLPDGRHFLFVSQAPTTIYVGSIDSADRTEVLAATSRAVYADGHVLFVRDGTLLGQPFDTRTLKVTGEAIPVADEVWYNAATAGSGVSVSASGVLAYRTGSTREASQLVWFDRSGKRLGVVGAVADQMNVGLSGDGRSVGVSLLDPIRSTRDIAIYDLARDGLRTRFTFDPADEWSVVWSPDGSRLAFNSARKNGQLDVYEKAATGAGAERLILDDPTNNVYPTSWSPDGRVLLFHNGNANSPTGNDIFALPMNGEPAAPVPIVQGASNETSAQLSRDGRWVAFA
jgi:Tol biopolymer transport system component/tRNA A-37 threonylcarbamoyl transferase component Bud32